MLFTVKSKWETNSGDENESQQDRCKNVLTSESSLSSNKSFKSFVATQKVEESESSDSENGY